MTPLSSDEARALLGRLRRNPDDLDEWRVFADWLDEHGDERGQLVRWEHRLADAALPDDERDELREQIADLVAECEAQWLDGLDIDDLERGREGVEPAGTWLRWRHGFVVGVRLRWSDGAALDVLAALAGHPVAALLASLDLRSSRLGADELSALLQSPALRDIVSLDLGENELGDAGAAALAASGALPELVSLNLHDNGIGDAGAAALASAVGLPRLASLHLAGNDIGDVGAAALASPPGLPGLTGLHLGRADTGWRRRFDAAVEALRARVGRVRYEPGDPVSEDVVERAARTVDREIPAALVAFYRSLNGVTVEWDGGRICIERMEAMFGGHGWEDVDDDEPWDEEPWGEVMCESIDDLDDEVREVFARLKQIESIEGASANIALDLTGDEPRLFYVDKCDLYLMDLTFSGYLDWALGTMGLDGWYLPFTSYRYYDAADLGRRLHAALPEGPMWHPGWPHPLPEGIRRTSR